MKVEHNLANFKEGQTVILTLEDKQVLDEEEGDTLVNVNIKDNEAAVQNVEKKKKKPLYNPYDDAEEDGFGMVCICLFYHTIVLTIFIKFVGSAVFGKYIIKRISNDKFMHSFF